ncbi:unnamed protein product, partial [Didymodactylos carnosus]
KTLEYVDLIRIDHFRGLEAHYVIPVDDIKKQTINGKKAHWKKTPGDEFFSVITSALGRDVPLIVEDLGDTTEEVYQLRDKYHLWGMRIIEMGFYYNPDNMYCPHNYVPNSFAYTNTHDNPPALLWWNKKTSASERRKFLAYISRPVDSDKELINGESLEKHVNKNINWYLIQMVLQSVSNGAIIAMQDLLGIERPRMNRPGSTSDPDYDGSQNWAWRFKWSELTTDIRKHLKLMTQLYGRDLPFGKAIAPDDMQMKDDDTTKCITITYLPPSIGQPAFYPYVRYSSELQLEDEEDSHRLRRTSSASSSSSQSTTVIPTPLSPHPTSFDATTLLHFGWGNQELRRGDSLKFCLMWDILVGLTINENVAELNLVHTQIKKFSVDPNVDVYEETMRFLTDPSDNICQNVLKWIGGRVISLRITLIDVIGGWSLVSSSLNYHQTTLLRRLHLIDIEPHEFDKLLRNRLVKQLHTLLIDVTNSSPFNYQ